VLGVSLRPSDEEAGGEKAHATGPFEKKRTSGGVNRKGESKATPMTTDYSAWENGVSIRREWNAQKRMPESRRRRREAQTSFTPSQINSWFSKSPLSLKTGGERERDKGKCMGRKENQGGGIC